MIERTGIQSTKWWWGLISNQTVKTKHGHEVASFSEAQIDNWFWENNWKCVYEPQIVINDEVYLPDWVVWPQKGIDKPIIVEYWGLLRDDKTVAAWVHKKRPRYLRRKAEKEMAYHGSELYYYMGVYPHEVNDLDKILLAKLEGLK